MKKIWKISGIAVGILLLLLIALYGMAKILVTPDRIRAVVVPRAEAALNRQISLGEIEVSLFSGIKIGQLQVSEPQENEAFLAADAIVLRYRLWPLLFKRVVIDEIRLVAPRIRIERLPDGSFNFSDLLQPLAGRDEPATESREGVPVDLLVSQVAIDHGTLHFIDRQLDAENPFRFEMTELQLAAREISLRQNFPVEMAAQAQGGMLQADGSINLQQAQGAGEVKISNLDLALFAPYFRDKVPGQVRELRLNLTLKGRGGA